MMNLELVRLKSLLGFDPRDGNGTLGECLRIWKMIDEYQPIVTTYQDANWEDGRQTLLRILETYINKQLQNVFVDFAADELKSVDNDTNENPNKIELPKNNTTGVPL